MLGSTAVSADSGGTKGAELRYKAYGETRYADRLTPTARRFTGQRAACFPQARQPGQTPYSRSTNCPSNSVATTCVSRMAIGSMLKMSWESTTRSASLPGVSVPLIASSPLA